MRFVRVWFGYIRTQNLMTCTITVTCTRSSNVPKIKMKCKAYYALSPQSDCNSCEIQIVYYWILEQGENRGRGGGWGVATYYILAMKGKPCLVLDKRQNNPQKYTVMKINFGFLFIPAYSMDKRSVPSFRCVELSPFSRQYYCDVMICEETNVITRKDTLPRPYHDYVTHSQQYLSREGRKLYITKRWKIILLTEVHGAWC